MRTVTYSLVGCVRILAMSVVAKTIMIMNAVRHVEALFRQTAAWLHMHWSNPSTLARHNRNNYPDNN